LVKSSDVVDFAAVKAPKSHRDQQETGTRAVNISIKSTYFH
jgi:hypothetical protein